MELDRNNAADLAQFFAKRFPQPHQRRELVDTARVVFREPATGGAFEAWALLLTRTQEQSALERLASAAARQDSDDENLQAVCALLAGRPWPPQPASQRRSGLLLSGGALLLGAAAAAALVFFTGGDPAPTAPEATPETTTAALQADPPAVAAPAPPAEPAPAPAEARPTPAPVAAAAPPPEPEPEPAPEPQPEPEPAPPAPAVAQSSPRSADAPPPLPATRAHHSGRCTVPDGGLVGYYYAGREAPGSKGQTIRVDRTAYVRADYPDRHNRYDRKAAVRCSVLEGDQLLLTAAPIQVPGDAYWVPVYSGAISGGTAQR